MGWLQDRWGRGPSLNGLKSSVKGTGHTIGKVADNKWVQGATAAALAATGVGAPAAAAIMAGMAGGGALLKKGGNIGDGLMGAAKGAAMGYGAGKAGQLLHGGIGVAGSGGTSATGAGASGGGAGILDAVRSGIGRVGKNAGTLETIGKAAGMIGTGVAGVGEWNASKGAERDMKGQLARMGTLADAQAKWGTDLMADQAPVRSAASGKLLEAINAGRRAPTSTAFLRDGANPFRASFDRPAEAPALPAPGPAVPPPPAGFRDVMRKFSKKGMA